MEEKALAATGRPITSPGPASGAAPAGGRGSASSGVADEAIGGEENKETRRLRTSVRAKMALPQMMQHATERALDASRTRREIET